MSVAGASLGYESAVSHSQFDGEAHSRRTGNTYDVSGTERTVTRSSSVTYQCTMPSREEQCEVSAAGAAAAVKQTFDPRWRNVLIGVGYYALIIPGIVLYEVFDGQADDTKKRAAEEHDRAYMRCLAMTRRPEPVATPAPVDDADEEAHGSPPVQAADFEAPAR